MNNQINILTEPFSIKYQAYFAYFFLIFCIIFSFIINDELFIIIQNSIADAYIAVTTFVAGTFLIFYSLEKYFKFDIGIFLKKYPKFEVIGSSFLGALPGCGGAIIVITQYIRGKISFGSVVATLTATMGDAAFLLIAKKPTVGLFVLILGFFVGTISGILVNLLHGKFFLRLTGCQLITKTNFEVKKIKYSKRLDKLWMIFIIPGIIIGILSAFQIDLDLMLKNSYFDKPITFFGFIAGCLCLIMWIFPIIHGCKFIPSTSKDSINRRTVSDTNFITGWVILAFLTFELSIYLANINLESLFNSYIYFLPLLAVVVGLLPGCGPQILVTTLYLGGMIPLSAQLGNAISNDGDALFPAIALHPKAAIIATLYSSIPAILVSYLYLLIFELNFLNF